MSVDFSSWPREQEQSFVVFEQFNGESSKKAWLAGGVVAAIFFFFMVGVYAGVAPDHKDITKDMNMSNLTKKDKDSNKAPAPAAEAK